MKLRETAKVSKEYILNSYYPNCSCTEYQTYSMKQSCGSSVLADGRLADLIRRVATFGMVLMKLDVRQVYIYILMKTEAAFGCSISTFPIDNLRKAWVKSFIALGIWPSHRST